MGCLIGIIRFVFAAFAGFVAFWIFELVVFKSLDGIILPFVGSALGATIVMIFVLSATKALAERLRRPPPAERCGNCDGTGWVTVQTVDQRGRNRGAMSMSCPACQTTGRRSL